MAASGSSIGIGTGIRIRIRIRIRIGIGIEAPWRKAWPDGQGGVFLLC